MNQPTAHLAFMNLEHHLAQLEDVPLLARMNRQLLRDEKHRNSSMTIPDLSKRMTGFLSEQGYQAVLFSVQNEPVAYALFIERPDDIYIRQLYVHKAFRRNGIGKEAIQILRDRYFPRKKKMSVEVLVKNKVATSFWRNSGFHDYSLCLENIPKD